MDRTCDASINKGAQEILPIRSRKRLSLLRE